jgi:adenylosuccinate lyase
VQDWGGVMGPARFVGRAPQQVEQFVAQVIEPIRHRYRAELGQQVELKV